MTSLTTIGFKSDVSQSMKSTYFKKTCIFHTLQKTKHLTIPPHITQLPTSRGNRSSGGKPSNQTLNNQTKCKVKIIVAYLSSVTWKTLICFYWNVYVPLAPNYRRRLSRTGWMWSCVPTCPRTRSQWRRERATLHRWRVKKHRQVFADLRLQLCTLDCHQSSECFRKILNRKYFIFWFVTVAYFDGQLPTMAVRGLIL